jgi:hypothetical protein
MGEGLVPPAQEENLLFEMAAADAGADAVLIGHVKGQWQYQAGGVPYYTDGGAGGEVYVGPLEETGVDSGYWHGYRLLHVRRGKLKFTDTVPVFVRDGITISGPASVEAGDTAQFEATGVQPTKEGALVDALELREPSPSRPNASKLTTPARIWVTTNRRVLAPETAEDDDPRRNPRRQTISGAFRARCPGTARIRIKSGWQVASVRVNVTGAAEGCPGR